MLQVDGVFTADPRKITNSRLLKEISRDQARLLTSYGSEVVHPLAIDQANRLNIPIVVKNVANPSGRGTRVVRTPSLARTLSFGGPSSTFAVTLLNDLEMAHVHFDDWELSPGRATGTVMDALKEYTGVANVVGVDLVASSQRDVCFMLSGKTGRAVGSEEGLKRALDALSKVAQVNIVEGLSYLQIVFMTPPHSSAMVAGLALSALANEGIEVKMISHGPMGHGIGCVVKQEDAQKAGAVVHDALLNMSVV
jgi:aspartate kinase